MMEKHMIFSLLLALASVISTVNGACIDHEAKPNNANATTMDKVSRFFEDVGCTLSSEWSVVKSKVASGYNYLKEKIDDSNHHNKTTTPTKKGTSNENSNTMNNNRNEIKTVDPDQIIFRETDPHMPNTEAPENFNTNKPATNQRETTSNQRETTPSYHTNSNVDTTSNFDTTSKYGTTVPLASEPPMTTDVTVDDRIALTAPDMCPKGEVRVNGKCRKEIKL